MQLKHSRGMMRLGATAALVIVALFAWALLSSHRASAKLKAQTQELSVVNVATIQPKREAINGDVTLSGNVQANVDAPIYARTSGYLRRWLVDIGAPVKKGQVLAEIDVPELDQQLRQARADVANAQASRNLAETTAKRWRSLRDTGTVSSQQVDEKIGQAETGAAQLQSAEANLQRLRELSAYKSIVAPFDGVVTARNTDIGQLVAGGSAGQELFRISDTRRLLLYVHVPQTYAAKMQPGLTATVAFPDRPGVKYPATLERTANALDASSRTLLVQLVIDNSKQELLAGAYAEVNFHIPDAAHTLAFTLPSNTLLTRGERLNVAAVDASNAVKIKPVTLGRDYGMEVEIVEGIEASDNVIVNPPDSLTDGATVRVIKPPAQGVAP